MGGSLTSPPATLEMVSISPLAKRTPTTLDGWSRYPEQSVLAVKRKNQHPFFSRSARLEWSSGAAAGMGRKTKEEERRLYACINPLSYNHVSREGEKLGHQFFYI